MVSHLDSSKQRDQTTFGSHHAGHSAGRFLPAQWLIATDRALLCGNRIQQALAVCQEENIGPKFFLDWWPANVV
jgi:hypothetical protein